MKQLVLSNLIGHGTEFEIRNFQISIIVEQEILGFKVAVINPTRVAKSDGRDQLLEVLASYVLFEPTFGNLVEQLAASHVFHDEVDFGFRGHDFEELHDVRVSDTAEDRDLALDVSDQTSFEDFLLVDYLDGHAFVGFHVSSVVDFREGPMA